ncbi:MAG TPA: nucleotide exchange factor GrpE [Thermohalobaculum sp.]|nr:nucleotide exchange factor GrpE [Thermohalobaculum sp.]
MAKKANGRPAGDARRQASDRPEGDAARGAEEENVKDTGTEASAGAEKARREAPGPDAPEEHEQEVGAPATGDGGGGATLDDLMPGLDEALGVGGVDANARIAELEAEKAEQKDQLLRALAELENTRRRAERDRRDAETYGGTRLARDLLVVHDNLARALGAADEELRERHGAFLEGVELTQRELLSAFGRHGIAKVSPEPGERFDPHLHQAMFEAPVPGAPDGTIIEVMEDGFTIADRLLRPARVGVARGGGSAAAPEAETDEAKSGD